MDISQEIGNRYGRLIVTGMAYRNFRGIPTMMVECDCGKSYMARLPNMKEGNTQSCGCLHSESAKKNLTKSHIKAIGKHGPRLKEFKDAIIDREFGSYRRNAIKRGFEFKLSKDEFISIVHGSCHYCGEKGVDEKRIIGSHLKPHDGKVYKCVGIDRIDNEKGYSISNCVPCCTKCNTMKMDSPQIEFIERCKKIARRF